MFILFLIWVFGIIALFCVGIFIYRVEWVFRKQKRLLNETTEAYKNYILYCIKTNKKLDKNLCLWLYNAFFDYDEMMRRFWIWDINRLIKDKRAYHFIQEWKNRNNF